MYVFIISFIITVACYFFVPSFICYNLKNITIKKLKIVVILNALFWFLIFTFCFYQLDPTVGPNSTPAFIWSILAYHTLKKKYANNFVTNIPEKKEFQACNLETEEPLIEKISISEENLTENITQEPLKDDPISENINTEIISTKTEKITPKNAHSIMFKLNIILCVIIICLSCYSAYIYKNLKTEILILDSKVKTLQSDCELLDRRYKNLKSEDETLHFLIETLAGSILGY